MLPIVSIVGRTNVGKSSLFNRLIGFRQAIVSYEPGTTRDRVVDEISWDNKKFILVDTAGLLVDYFGFKETEIEQKAQQQIKEALQESNIILFVIDTKEGLLAQDKLIANEIRKLGKRIILVANKADSEKAEQESLSLKRFGFEEFMAVSAQTGRRSGDLLNLITRDFPEIQTEKKKLPRLAIVGRPNVGKSTLFNDLTRSERAIVSEIPGTTRDAIKLQIKLKDKKESLDLEIIDTAGFRRRGKILPGIEKFSVIRTISSIAQSDLVLIIIDAKEGLTRGDVHLVQIAADARKQIILVFNKIDLLIEKSVEEIPQIGRFDFLKRYPAVAVSAKNKTNLELLIEQIITLLRRMPPTPVGG